MMTRPRVSIVLPTYNGGCYIDGAIESCLQQSERNWELIIVDDGSTDDTPRRIARYLGDSRIMAVRHEINRKLPAALNTGFALSRGDYLTWSSDDNYYRPHALSTMLRYLDAHPETDLVYADYTRIDQGGRPIGDIRVSPPEALLHGNCVGPCFLYRRAVYEALGGYDERLFLVEDYEYWLRVSTRFRLTPLHENLYLYRTHSKSLTSRRQERIVTLADRVLLHYLPELFGADRSMVARAFFSVGLRRMRMGTEKAVACMDRAMDGLDLVGRDRDFVVRELLYADSTTLHAEDEVESLLARLAERYPAMRDLGRHVWAEYHTVRCYEAQRDGCPEQARRHLPLVLRRNPARLRNRGFMRLALWALAHREQGGTA
jgi:hypothetical protein